MTMASDMSLMNKVNMTNCYKQRQRFFEKYESIDFDSMIAYWMMAGYFDPIESIHQAYEKGQEMLRELTNERLPNLNHCRHEALCTTGDIGFVDFLDLRQTGNVALTNGMLKDEKGSFLLIIDESHLSSSSQELITSSKGLKYLVFYYSSPHLIMSFLENVDNPSLLLLRHCNVFEDTELLLLLLQKLKTLTVLEISDKFVDISYGMFSELTQLQYLKLSMEDTELPEDCFSELKQLRWLILRNCSELEILPSLQDLSNLEVLDLSLCRSLRKIPSNRISSPKLQMVDLSSTCLESIPQLETTKLTHLFLRYSELSVYGKVKIKHPSRLQVLDLSNSEELGEIDLSLHNDLIVLDLSHTIISCIDSISDMVRLRKLILKGCASLQKLPSLEKLESLEELDLSGTEVSCLPSFAIPSRLLKLSLGGLKLESLETLASLSSLVELDLSRVKISESEKLKVGFLQSLKNLRILNLLGTSVAEHLDPKILINLETLKLTRHDHSSSASNLVLTKTSPAEMLNDSHSNDQSISSLIERIRQALNTCDTASSNEGYKRKIETLRADVEYIYKKDNRLKTFPHQKRAKELLQHLFDADDRSKYEFADLKKFQLLIDTVGKLKMMVTPRHASFNKEFAGLKKNVADKFCKEFAYLKIPQANTDQLLSSYHSLTENQKHCLLCFSGFSCDVDEDKNTGVLISKIIDIKKKILIYWWIGEGFIHLDCEENVATEVSEAVPGQRGKRNKTVEEIGEQILKVLTEKGFIEPVIENRWETGRCRMHPFIHSFVTEQAKNANFFNFRARLVKSEDSFSSTSAIKKYTTSGRRLKSFKTVQTLFNANESIVNIQQEWFSKMKDLSVLHLGNWKYGTTEHIEVWDQKFLEDLKNMKQLKLISLQGVSTIMKLPDSVCQASNLRILNLRECHDLEELPADIGSLKNLTHLDLTNCHLLTKLPQGISSLSKLEVLKGFVIYDKFGDPQDKKVSILDHCRKMAKGHLIYDLLHFKNSKVCTLRDLLKLKNLRKLNIYVNSKNFPKSEELKVFKEMENLRKLMISWQGSFKDEDKNASRGQTSTNQGGHEALDEDQQEIEVSREGQGDNEMLEEDVADIQDPKEDQEDDRAPEEDQGENKAPEDSSNTCGRGAFLEQIEKLELWCFPHETVPDWLAPIQLKNLEKLYIKGGKLSRLPGGTGGNEWKVKTLRLKYLPDLVMTWRDLKAKFPKVTYLEMYNCEKLRPTPCDYKGVWRVEDELPRDLESEHIAL